MGTLRFGISASFALAIAVTIACSGSSNAGIGDGGGGTGGGSGSPNQTGLTCSSANQCYVGLDAAAVKGQVVCLTQLQNGYCSHTCSADADCCALSGECAGIKEICAPLQSAGQMYCVLSCETADIPAGADPTVFCQQHANTSFTCRSTGGGSKNRKFCGP